MDETNKDTFSFSKAYEQFKTAASLGHTMAAYNLGVMHFTGLGTFKSCNVANAFLKHVVTMGEDSIDMKRAYKLVEPTRENGGAGLEVSPQGLEVVARRALKVRMDWHTPEAKMRYQLQQRQRKPGVVYPTTEGDTVASSSFHAKYLPGIPRKRSNERENQTNPC